MTTNLGMNDDTDDDHDDLSATHTKERCQRVMTQHPLPRDFL